jgi:uncharacterized protein (DUF302 family)
MTDRTGPEEETVQALEVTVTKPLPEAEAEVRQELSKVGFGVLTEIDVAATFKAKLDITRAPLKILGACNPSFAHRALGLDPTLALLLPCNVVLESLATGRTRIAIADPRALLGASDLASAELRALGDEAVEALATVTAALGS